MLHENNRDEINDDGRMHDFLVEEEELAFGISCGKLMMLDKAGLSLP